MPRFGPSKTAKKIALIIVKTGVTLAAGWLARPRLGPAFLYFRETKFTTERASRVAHGRGGIPQVPRRPDPRSPGPI